MKGQGVKHTRLQGKVASEFSTYIVFPPYTAELLEGAEEDILAFMAFPIEHWSRIYSTNPLERLNKEIKRRTNVVGIFPDQTSVIRLVGSMLTEVSDEWQIGRRYFKPGIDEESDGAGTLVGS